VKPGREHQARQDAQSAADDALDAFESAEIRAIPRRNGCPIGRPTGD
jgi:hypothetical protein